MLFVERLERYRACM